MIIRTINANEFPKLFILSSRIYYLNSSVKTFVPIKFYPIVFIYTYSNNLYSLFVATNKLQFHRNYEDAPLQKLINIPYIDVFKMLTLSVARTLRKAKALFHWRKRTARSAKVIEVVTIRWKFLMTESARTAILFDCIRGRIAREIWRVRKSSVFTFWKYHEIGSYRYKITKVFISVKRLFKCISALRNVTIVIVLLR